MVYAPHGRTGVYMLQDALGVLAPERDMPAARLDVARRVMRHLPETAWLRANQNFGDHIDGGDAGLYDLLLNPRDRAYTVTALAALLAGAGLAITGWMEPMRYDPTAFLPDPKLRARIAALDPIAQASLAEALSGNMSTHVVYCVRAADAPPVPDPMRAAAVPVAREMPAAEIARAIRPDGTLPFVFDGLRVPVALPKLAGAILGQIDGARPVAAILDTVAGEGGDGRSGGESVAGDLCRSGSGEPDPVGRAGLRPVIIIFGAAVRPDGKPSGALRARVEAAFETGRPLADPIYVPTGGQGRYGRPEADVMADVLIGLGVTPEAILREPTARNTLRSALACARLLGGSRAPAYVATSAYHMPRCVLLLRLAGVRARPGCTPPVIASRNWRKRWWWRLREVPAVPVDAILVLAARPWSRRQM